MNMHEHQAIKEFSKLDRLKGLLLDWAQWTSHYRPRLGTKSQSIFTSTGGHDFESLFNETENLVMKAVDTCIDDLIKKQRFAIERRYLGHTHDFLGGNTAYVLLLDQAHEALIPMLIKRNVML